MTTLFIYFWDTMRDWMHCALRLFLWRWLHQHCLCSFASTETWQMPFIGSLKAWIPVVAINVLYLYSELIHGSTGFWTTLKSQGRIYLQHWMQEGVAIGEADHKHNSIKRDRRASREVSRSEHPQARLDAIFWEHSLLGWWPGSLVTS